MQVPLSNIVLVISTWVTDPIITSGEENTITLALVIRLDDVSLGPSTIKLVFEFLGVRWDDPGLWEKVILIWQRFLHQVQVLGKAFFPPEYVNTQ